MTTPSSGHDKPSHATLADDLRAARALIDRPEKYRVGFGSLFASKRNQTLDLNGALIAATNTVPYAAFPLADALQDALNGAVLDSYVHSASHADIMALFDRAILAAQGTPS